MPLRFPVTENDHIRGNAAAAIEVVEYGDYQCPHCGRAHPMVKELQQCLGDKIKFVFRNFPLKKIHPQAREAAIATEAAALQGKYWEMHDLVFEHQRRLHNSALMEYAAQLDLDLAQFSQDIADPKLDELVEDHFIGGMRSGVNATPTFFINGEKFEQSWEDKGLLAFIKEKYGDVL